MKLFCDHDELIAQLKGERDRLQGQVVTLQGIVTSLTQANEKMAKEFLAVAQQRQGAGTVQQPITREEIARKFGLPLALADRIDFERLGYQFAGEKR
jgi:hypothetical protein